MKLFCSATLQLLTGLPPWQLLRRFCLTEQLERIASAHKGGGTCRRRCSILSCTTKSNDVSPPSNAPVQILMPLLLTAS